MGKGETSHQVEINTGGGITGPAVKEKTVSRSILIQPPGTVVATGKQLAVNPGRFFGIPIV